MKPGEELLLLNGWENQTQKVGLKESTAISMHRRLSGRKCRQENVGSISYELGTVSVVILLILYWSVRTFSTDRLSNDLSRWNVNCSMYI
ncbi:hypothetical protein H5410_048999 [Solanum commersonii]|uniref:Uncharacterized protein n=1 Tax=Solanum commersonii TaxID=4109 RepID=A0A9J5XL56_SOLCO|nr:hypothetical protein H5410_048999 [Solanum commersonii]